MVLLVDSITIARWTQHAGVLAITVSIREAHFEISSIPDEIILTLL